MGISHPFPAQVLAAGDARADARLLRELCAAALTCAGDCAARADPPRPGDAARCYEAAVAEVAKMLEAAGGGGDDDGAPAHRIFVAGAASHAGKSTVCLGLLSALAERWGAGSVAYIKPATQDERLDGVARWCDARGVARVAGRAGQESEIPNFKASYLGRFPLVLADFWTSDRLSERFRSVDAFFGTRARGTLTLKRR